jgi:hypothetical protein
MFLQWSLYLKKSPEYKLLFLQYWQWFLYLKESPMYTFLSQKAGASSVLNSIPVLSDTMQDDSRANYSDLYSRRSQFEYRTEYRLSWLLLFLDFLSRCRQTPEEDFKLWHGRFLPHYFQFIIHYLTLVGCYKI